MSSGYALPVAAWLTRESGERVVVLPDGTQMPISEWKEKRVSPEEFARLSLLKQEKRAASRRMGPEDPDDL